MRDGSGNGRPDGADHRNSRAGILFRRAGGPAAPVSDPQFGPRPDVKDNPELDHQGGRNSRAANEKRLSDVATYDDQGVGRRYWRFAGGGGRAISPISS